MGVRFPPDVQYDSVAQLVEHLTFNQRVVSSSLTGITRKYMESPCIKICKLNEEDVCIGCGRTKEEITGWRSMNDEERTKKIQEVTQRILQKKMAP